ncbi:MAG: riboflavin biosynthesis protein RibF [Lachnospiraceae bacterium]|nr:riboflavin biosynthesis protein RibF [Lachnospiraceae bacterium]
MQFYDDINRIPDLPSSAVIGKFDGMHLGHRKLITRAVKEKRPGMQTVVFTFSNPVADVVSCDAGRGQLVTSAERKELAEAFGADVLVEYPFDENTRHMTAEDFYENILQKALHAESIAAGPDCAFGYQRKGNLEFLKRMEKEGGIHVVPVEKAQYLHEDISSTRIKQELRAGNMEAVNAMLGYEYGFRSEVVHGRHLGHSLGFPTINQIPSPGKALPPFGVYAARVTVKDRSFAGVANVGIKPTVTSEGPGVETHIIGFNEDVYGEEADVRLLAFIRPERRFADLAALSAQIAADREAVLERNVTG